MDPTYRTLIVLILCVIWTAACGGRDNDEIPETIMTGTPTVETLAPVESAPQEEDAAVPSEGEKAAVDPASNQAPQRAPVVQVVECDPLRDVVKGAIDLCQIIEDNWACYGHPEVNTVPAIGQFANQGDQHPVVEFTKLTTALDTGVAVLRMVVTSSRNPVVMLSMGGSSLQPEGVLSYTLETTPAGELLCQNTPSGLTVRTEEGLPATLIVNGVEIELASAAFITQPDPNTLLLVNLSGNMTVRVAGQKRDLEPRWQVEVIDVNGSDPTLGEPEPSRYAQSEVLQWLANDPRGLDLVRGPASARASSVDSDESLADVTDVSPGRIPGCTVICPDGWGYYRVQSGDTLTAIRAKTTYFEEDLTIDRLKEVNCISPDSDVIQRDALICVPAPPVPTSTPTQVSDSPTRRKVPTPTPCPEMTISFGFKPVPNGTNEEEYDDAKDYDDVESPSLKRVRLVWNIQGGCDPVSLTMIQKDAQQQEEQLPITQIREGFYDVSAACTADFTLKASAASGPTKTRQIQYQECESYSTDDGNGSEEGTGQSSEGGG